MRALALLLAGCASSTSLKAQTATTEHVETHTSASGTEHEGPWTETVWEFAPLAVAEGEGLEPPRAVNPRRFSRPVPCQFGQPSDCSTLPDPDSLVKVTVRDHYGRDVTWQASSDGLAGAETHASVAQASESKPSGGCALGLGFWGALSLAGALTLAYRFRAPIWAVCKRLAGIP